MSDIKPNHGVEGEPTSNIEQDEALSGPVPHSGELPRDDGGERVDEEQVGPLREAIVTPPDVVTIGAPAPSEEDPHKRKWLQPAIAALAALALAAGAFVVGSRSGGGEEEASSEDPTEATEPTLAPAGEGGPPTTDLLVDEPEVEVEEEPGVTPDVDLTQLGPALMVAETYDGLLSEFRNNMFCMFNSPYPGVRDECLTYIVGNGTGPLTSELQSRIDAVVDHRISNPDYIVDLEFADPTPGSTTDNFRLDGTDEAQLVAELTDPSGTTIQRYRFTRQPVVTIDERLLAEGSSVVDAWVLYDVDTLQPGDVLLED